MKEKIRRVHVCGFQKCVLAFSATTSTCNKLCGVRLTGRLHCFHHFKICACSIVAADT